MQLHLNTIINAIYPKKRNNKTTINEWFTRDERILIMNQIKQVIELSNITIGVKDDQTLLMDLFINKLEDH